MKNQNNVIYRFGFMHGTHVSSFGIEHQVTQDWLWLLAASKETS